MAPSVYIIAGPNGAGKTTFAREFLPRYAACTNFVNADLIAQGVAPLAPESAEIRAGRLMLEQIKFFAGKGVDFGFETTLAGRGYITLIRRLRRQGYAIHFFYLWVSSVHLALSRIKGRVRKGGHDVPERIVRRRYDRSIRNFLQRYRQLGDSWTLFDNSLETPTEIACGEAVEVRIMRAELYDDLLKQHRAK
ncbi:MAG: zeta toxin family protein [Terriglobia bacterium]